MAQPVHPHHGARFQIVRQSNTDSTAAYRVDIFVDDGVYARTACLSTGSSEVAWADAESPQPPGQPMAPWMKKHAEALLRQMRQGAERNGVWGRRIRRWKDAPAAKASQPS